MVAEIFVSFALAYLTYYIITTIVMRRNKPPGPFPYPLIGNIPHLFCDPINPYSKLADEYGDIFSLTFPTGETVVVLNSAKLAREARLGKQENLSGKSPGSIYPWPEIFGKDLMTADYSPEMRFRRRVFKAAMHVFGAGIGEVSERAGHAVQTSIKEIDIHKGKPFSPRKILESSIIIQIWDWLTTEKFQSNNPTVKKLSLFNALCTKQVLLSSFYQMVPFILHLPLQITRDLNTAKQIRNAVFSVEYESHKKTYIPGVIRDLTDSFINCYEKEIAKETNKSIGSVDDVAGLMADVIFAGSDTASSSLAWFLLYMVLYPETQAKIHEELDVVVGKNRTPCWNDAQNMPFLQATLCEVQRASGMIGVVGTNAIRDMQIAGYHIPKGTFVALNLAKLHHDEREWPEPEKFNPGRFLDSDGKFVGWSKLNGFLPFSVGRRDCPGQSLAKIMMFAFSSMLLHRYKIELPAEAETPTTKITEAAITRRPKDYKIIAKQRN
ncbi:cytochrome P450 2D4-like [Dendronephthya gigantea]|uniref:cytochrome P450 2D4-like n=1 Tax=Dendronephthya gigantea TaxID=151771 RepID=UPI00106CAB5A|nr:cytochrome P450 2D4-like [Dendronephthya gigantea]